VLQAQWGPPCLRSLQALLARRCRGPFCSFIWVVSLHRASSSSDGCLSNRGYNAARLCGGRRSSSPTRTSAPSAPPLTKTPRTLRSAVPSPAASGTRSAGVLRQLPMPVICMRSLG
jgi:hypothetical protein